MTQNWWLILPALRSHRLDPWVRKIWYSCLENPMVRGAWCYSPESCKESDMTEWLSKHTHQSHILCEQWRLALFHFSFFPMEGANGFIKKKGLFANWNCLICPAKQPNTAGGPNNQSLSWGLAPARAHTTWEAAEKRQHVHSVCSYFLGTSTVQFTSASAVHVEYSLHI